MDFGFWILDIAGCETEGNLNLRNSSRWKKIVWLWGRGTVPGKTGQVSLSWESFLRVKSAADGGTDEAALGAGLFWDGEDTGGTWSPPGALRMCPSQHLLLSCLLRTGFGAWRKQSVITYTFGWLSFALL